MRNLVRAAYIAALIASVTLPALSDPTPPPANALQTPPPQIYHVYVRPACAELNQHLLPMVAMVLQDDKDIAKSPAIFDNYIATALKSSSGSSTFDETDYDSPGRTMALQNMEGLVPLLATNVIAIQKILENTSFAQPTGIASDDAVLKALRSQLHGVLAMQRVSLDLINGFVTTQQLGDMQHAGEEYLSSINGTGLTSTPDPETSQPNFQDPNAPGLAPSPYDIEPGQIPGLMIGYNPVRDVANAVKWVQNETSKREGGVAGSLNQLAASCKVSPAAH
jgi:hypothetical protein